MKSWKRFESIVIIICFVILSGFLIAVSLSAPLHRVGDSSTYYLQISSIAEDFDIQYQPVDIQRALSNKFDDLPKGLILIKTDEGSYYYGKEFSYALFASPFFILLSNHGILFFNALMFFLMILMGFFYLRKKGNSPILSFFTSLVFFLLSTAFVYIFWIHVEIYNMFLITAGIFFWSLYIDDQNKNQYLIIAAFIFGLATVAKLPNSLLFLPFVCYELYNRQYKRAISIVLIFLIPIITFYSFFYLETGSMSFYGGNRLYYLNQYPFTDGFDGVNESGRLAFSVEEGRISALLSSDVLTKSPINLFYYFFGKFTGMIWYYPLTVFALISFVMGILYLKKQNSENYTILSIIRKNPIPSLVFIGII
jgi:dolichyl-phosphate-mannose--protein O-mannosyl transferase